MNFEEIFLIVWCVALTGLVCFFIVNGVKAVRTFPKLDKSEFEFFENMASGYSTKSFITRMGGANKVLQIRVTKDSLWLKTNFFLAFVAVRFDLLHLIPIESLTNISTDGKLINIDFTSNGKLKKVVLLSQSQAELVRVLSEKMSTSISEKENKV